MHWRPSCFTAQALLEIEASRLVPSRERLEHCPEAGEALAGCDAVQPALPRLVVAPEVVRLSRLLRREHFLLRELQLFDVLVDFVDFGPLRGDLLLELRDLFLSVLDGTLGLGGAAGVSGARARTWSG